MKDTAITYSWTRNGEFYQKEIDREDFFSMFKGLEKGFEKIGDNEISKKLVEIIPEVDEININYDISINQDIPCIACVINGDLELIKIMRCHEIIWSILKKYCTE